jgi:tetratricopeptide (TPR) repeat protein
MTLFSTDVNSSPNSCQVRRHYGSEIIYQGITEKDEKKKSESFDKGVEQLKIALKINPHFGDAFFKLGVAYQTVKVNNDSAIYYYTRAIQEAPGYAISYNNMGILYEGLGKQDYASYYYNKAVDANPFFPDGVKNRDAHRKKYGLDVRMFPTSTNLDSLINTTPESKRDFNFYYRLGTDYASKGDYMNAARSLEKAVEMNPTFVDAMVNLSNCYGMLKDYKKNIEVLNKVVALYPNNAQALGNLAVTYELLGDKDKSEEYRDKVRKLNGQ